MFPESVHKTPDWFDQRLSDGGPVYMETDLEHFIVEPWNAISSLFIVLPALIWLVRIGREYKKYKFLLYAMPLMLLGGAGSTLFHAFRVNRFFLFMDVLPTALLTVSLTIYFWVKVFKRWWYVLFIIIPSVLLRVILFRHVTLSDFMTINISYTMTGLLIGMPLLILLIRTHYYKLYAVILTILLFIGAIVFREMDAREIDFLPMGTHFLWHILTGFGAYYMLAYLFYYRKRELEFEA